MSLTRVKDLSAATKLTVDTDTLKVDEINNHVGIGTATPAKPLSVNLAGGGDFIAEFQNTTDATPYGIHVKDAASGANGYPLLQVTNAAGSQAYFRVDSGTGYVTTPKRPSMAGRAIRPAPSNGYVTTGVNLYHNVLDHNTGNHWNNSNGVWTCPVAGKYYCYASFLIDDNHGSGVLARFGFKKNGSEFFVSYNHDKYGSSYGGMATTGGIFDCAANDTIVCVATHGAFHAGAESSFSICFLG